MRRFSTGWAALVCLAVGCEESPARDAGPEDSGRAVDANGSVDSGPSCLGADGLPCLTTSFGAPANYACAPSMPTPGEPRAITMIVADDIGGGAAGAGVDVHVFPDNVVADACADGCIALTTDAMGRATVDLRASSWIAYRVISTGDGPEDIFGSVGYRIIRPTDTMKRVAFVTNGGVARIADEIGRVIEPGTGVIAGTIYDCDDQSVVGATIRVFVDDVEITTGSAPTDPLVTYPDALSPSTLGETTGMFGRYLAANLPAPASAIVRVEVYGARAAGEPRERVACEESLLLPDTYTTRPLRPLRTDYPATSGCATAP